MEIAEVQLTNFRNYEALTLGLYPGVNVLYGLNGQGKTNLLEALYLCTAARSHRTARDRDLIRHEADGYRVKVTFAPKRPDADYRESLELRYQSGQGAIPGGGQGSGRPTRTILHDGMELERIADLMGIFHAVMFAPEDLQLIKEGPGARRRFLDILISQLKPLYFLHLQRLQTILSQRNALLKRLQSPSYRPSGMAELVIWNEQLADVSAHIINERYLFCQQVSNVASSFHTLISGEKEALTVRYRTRSGLDARAPHDVLKSQILKELSEVEDDDIFRGYTTIGPQRDDMVFRLDGKDLKHYGSQGQQRTAVLALKLSELRIIAETVGEQPILLLDDVMSELDQYRRRALVEAITDAQIFITCTDPEQVVRDLEGERGQIHLFQVQEGRVRDVSRDETVI